MDEMTLTLNSPITEEQWDAITDVDLEHTNDITFYTKHGKEVKFVKASAQPERLTDDDFETIRILLNADKEKLCNQHRWKEAEEYQRIIDRFMAFASAQPEIIRCKDCKYQEKEWIEDKRFKDNGYWVYGCEVISDACGYWAWFGQDDEFCSDAERREDENGTD